MTDQEKIDRLSEALRRLHDIWSDEHLSHSILDTQPWEEGMREVFREVSPLIYDPIPPQPGAYGEEFDYRGFRAKLVEGEGWQVAKRPQPSDQRPDVLRSGLVNTRAVQGWIDWYLDKYG